MIATNAFRATSVFRQTVNFLPMSNLASTNKRSRNRSCPTGAKMCNQLGDQYSAWRKNYCICVIKDQKKRFPSGASVVINIQFDRMFCKKSFSKFSLETSTEIGSEFLHLSPLLHFSRDYFFDVPRLMLPIILDCMF